MSRQNDAALMRRAIELAGSHRTHPNPRVGAVVLSPTGQVIGEGTHLGPGHPHAEAAALDKAGPQARGGSVVVTLEPCNFHGRTPPCVDAIVASGVTRVVVGATDPDSRVAGQGIAALLSHGIEVEVGVLASESEAVDPAYFHHRRTGRPRITLKAALTLDGQLAASDGTSKWITGEEARADGQRLRAEADAVMVGAGTVISDDPRLDVRTPGYAGPQPRPIVLVGARDLPPASKVLQRRPLLVSGRHLDADADVKQVAMGPDGRPRLEEVLRAVSDEGYLELLVEGGAGVASALWAEGLVDRGVFYLAGRIAGGRGLGLFDGTWNTLAEAVDIRILDVERLGSDMRVEWAPIRNP